MSGRLASAGGPIGVFDSGLGGLTVVRRITSLLPNERILFAADQLHVPYGGRDLSEVRGFACGISAGLLKAGCKAVVMACNISSATALETVQNAYPNSLVLGVIAAGAEAAVRGTKSGRIGVLATVGTVRTEAYTKAINSMRPEFAVQEVACPEFVPLVEAGAVETPAAFSIAQTYLAPLLAAKVDTIILGCTHYPFLLPVLRRAAPHVRFVDPAEQTAMELAAQLRMLSLAATDKHGEKSLLTTTGDLDRFSAQSRLFFSFNADEFDLRAAHWEEDVGTFRV